MGIRDLFSGGGKGKKAGGKAAADSFSDYNGMRVEVLGGDGTPLFLAKFVSTVGGQVRLEEITPPENPPEEGTVLQAEMRGYHEAQKKAVHFSCLLTCAGGGTWQAENVKVTAKDNDRSFFRQGVEIAGELVPVGKPGGASAPCQVINLSAGGAGIRTGAAYEEGDRLLLRAQILPGRTPLLCRVRRVTQNSKGLYEYGCEFLDLNSSTEDQLARAIAELQMKRMKR